MGSHYVGTTTPEPIRDMWQTPVEVFNYFNKRFHFDMDVAANSQNALVPNFLTEVDDALDPGTEWGKTNWINPPYSKINPWVERAINEKVLGNTSVMLLPADTSTQWFFRAWCFASEIIFISGRLGFINADTGKPVNGNNKGSVVFVFNGAGGGHEVSLIHREIIMESGRDTTS